MIVPARPWRTDGPRAIPQAFPYQGSKRQLAGQILSLFPEDTTALIEPFAGSAAISVAARKYGLVDAVTISDVNAPLMDLWAAIINEPAALVRKYTKMWEEQVDNPKQYFFDIRARFNETKDPAMLLYLLCRIVKAAVRYGRNGDFNQSADNRRLGAKPHIVRERAQATSALLQGATLVTGSYEPLLSAASQGALVYMDPPYQGTSDVPDSRYLLGVQRDTFAANLQEAVGRGVSFIVSYDVVTHDNRYGEALPDSLGLLHRNVVVGTSSQATLLGRNEVSVESLYLSPALVDRLGGGKQVDARLDLADYQPDRLI